MDGKSNFARGVLKIALGIFFGGLLLWLSVSFVIGLQMKQAEREAIEALQRIGADAQARSEKLRRQQQQRREYERQRKAREQAAATHAARERIDEERRKEEAWNRFFQPTEECQQTTSVECGNAYIRARREFERTYQLTR